MESAKAARKRSPPPRSARTVCEFESKRAPPSLSFERSPRNLLLQLKGNRRTEAKLEMSDSPTLQPKTRRLTRRPELGDLGNLVKRRIHGQGQTNAPGGSAGKSGIRRLVCSEFFRMRKPVLVARRGRCRDELKVALPWIATTPSAPIW